MAARQRGRSDDWKVVYELPPPRDIPTKELVTFKDWRRQGTNLRSPKASRRELPFDPVARHIREGVQRLNDACDKLIVTGCARPRFVRKFGPNIFLHGRFYATGHGDCFQSIRRGDRRFITINGEPIAEVDIKAAALAIALVRCGGNIPESDPYEIEGFDRETIKRYCTQAIYPGKLRTKWPQKGEQPTVPCKAVRDAVLRRYPELERLPELAPEWAIKGMPLTPRTQKMPKGMLEWASGQFLVSLESGVIATAIGRILDEGGIAWPLHDALIVPVSGAERAQEVLRGAFRESLGQYARVTVTRFG